MSGSLHRITAQSIVGFGFNHVISILNFKDGGDGGGAPMLYWWSYFNRILVDNQLARHYEWGDRKTWMMDCDSKNQGG